MLLEYSCEGEQPLSAQPNPTLEELPRKISVAEYLELLRKSDERLEYVDGVVIAMAGESLPHNEVAGNIYSELKVEFRGRSCKVYFEGIKIRVSSTQYRYPDVVALCGTPQIDSQEPPSLLNPQVIFEVLSPSTEEFDKGDKFAEYKQIASLMDYILISQEKMNVVHYARQSPTQWIVTEFTNAEDIIVLAPLGVSLTIAAIYQEIELP